MLGCEDQETLSEPLENGKASGPTNPVGLTRGPPADGAQSVLLLVEYWSLEGFLGEISFKLGL